MQKRRAAGLAAFVLIDASNYRFENWKLCIYLKILDNIGRSIFANDLRSTPSIGHCVKGTKRFNLPAAVRSRIATLSIVTSGSDNP
jgi:hypothetical protein